MKDPSEAVQSAHEFVDNIDWALIEEAAEMGATVVAYMRRHPWMLMTAGAFLTGLGIWQMVDQRSGALSQKATELKDLVRR